MAALFPRKEGVNTIERAALSFGMSIVVVPLIGLILNYTWWEITMESTLYSVTSFIFLASIVAWIRRKRLSVLERFNIKFQMKMPGWGGGILEKVLSVVLAITIMGALGTLGYVIAAPKFGERFTEFYILGTEGMVADYPQELVVGGEGEVIIGISNREYKRVNYHIEVMIGNVKNNEIGPVELEHDEKWEGTLVFIPSEPGTDRKVEFLLFKDGEAEPCLEPLHLWIDVKG